MVSWNFSSTNILISICSSNFCWSWALLCLSWPWLFWWWSKSMRLSNVFTSLQLKSISNFCVSNKHSEHGSTLLDINHTIIVNINISPYFWHSLIDIIISFGSMESKMSLNHFSSNGICSVSFQVELSIWLSICISLNWISTYKRIHQSIVLLLSELSWDFSGIIRTGVVFESERWELWLCWLSSPWTLNWVRSKFLF